MSLILIVNEMLSYMIPQGSFECDENATIIAESFISGEVHGIAPWKVITAPLRVFASEDATAIITIHFFAHNERSFQSS